MNTRPNTAAIFTFILGVAIAIAGPSFADLVRGDIVVFGDGETLTATDLNTNFDVLATAVEELEARRPMVRRTDSTRQDTYGGEAHAVTAWCDEGWTAISGRCYTENGSGRHEPSDIRMELLGSFDAQEGGLSGWTCSFRNTNTSDGEGSIEVAFVSAMCIYADYER